MSPSNSKAETSLMKDFDTGYVICPDGNQEHAYNAIRKTTTKLCQKVRATYLMERETWQVPTIEAEPKTII